LHFLKVLLRLHDFWKEYILRGTQGNFGSEGFIKPPWIFQSHGLTLTASTFTRISPSFGTGTGISTFCMYINFIFIRDNTTNYLINHREKHFIKKTTERNNFSMDYNFFVCIKSTLRLVNNATQRLIYNQRMGSIDPIYFQNFSTGVQCCYIFSIKMLQVLRTLTPYIFWSIYIYI
jgi:hypothetical protein